MERLPYGGTECLRQVAFISCGGGGCGCGCGCGGVGWLLNSDAQVHMREFLSKAKKRFHNRVLGQKSKQVLPSKLAAAASSSGITPIPQQIEIGALVTFPLASSLLPRFSLTLSLKSNILQRLDGDLLSVAACVCRQWHALIQKDSLWEHTCFYHVSPSASMVGPVVGALCGYRRMYVVCVRLVESQSRGRVWTRQEVELWLSRFCVNYYERSLGGIGGGASWLMFKYKVMK
ncbi:hypothetical protein LguiB_002663 [Lonicera macranthoides]